MLGTGGFTRMARCENIETVEWTGRTACSRGARGLNAIIAETTSLLVVDAAGADVWAADVLTRSRRIANEDFYCALPLNSSLYAVGSRRRYRLRYFGWLR
jgi:hypothetical protein